MNDIVDRLRSGEDGLEYAAADEIERLREELAQCLKMKSDLVLKAYPAMDERDDLLRQIAEMRKALEPFAAYASRAGFGLDHKGQERPDSEGVGWVYLMNRDFRRARAALADEPAPKEPLK